MERGFTICVYAADPWSACLAAEGDEKGYPGDKKAAVYLAIVEYGGIRAFLYASFYGVGLRRVLVCGGYMADNYCGGGAFDAFVWKTDSGKKLVMFGYHSCGDFFAPIIPCARDGNGWTAYGPGADNRGGICLSFGKQKNDAACLR